MNAWILFEAKSRNWSPTFKRHRPSEKGISHVRFQILPLLRQPAQCDRSVLPDMWRSICRGGKACAQGAIKAETATQQPCVSRPNLRITIPRLLCADRRIPRGQEVGSIVQRYNAGGL